jgi:hypothetical protein
VFNNLGMVFEAPTGTMFAFPSVLLAHYDAHFCSAPDEAAALRGEGEKRGCVRSPPSHRRLPFLSQLSLLPFPFLPILLTCSPLQQANGTVKRIPRWSRTFGQLCSSSPSFPSLPSFLQRSPPLFYSRNKTQFTASSSLALPPLSPFRPSDPSALDRFIQHVFGLPRLTTRSSTANRVLHLILSGELVDISAV